MINHLKSILDASKDRVRSPWFGSVVIAWICFNWKMLAILVFSKNTIEQKIATTIEKYYSIELWIIYPIAVAAFYTTLSPLISFGVFKINHFFKVRLDIVKMKAELKLLEYESELKYRRKRSELLEKERFDNLDDYSTKRERVTDVESKPMK
jgi:hypothetical protein